MTVAAQARAAACNFEAKKTGFGQAQDGWSITLRVQHDDLPAHIKDARKGTRYMVALVEIGDDEQPISPEVPAPSSSRVSSSDERKPESDPGSMTERGHTKKSPAQIAGYLCTTVSFQKFLHERFNQAWLRARQTHNTLGASVLPEVIAADVVRELCEVESRADIHSDNTEWLSLQLAYKLWQNHPELEDA